MNDTYELTPKGQLFLRWLQEHPEYTDDLNDEDFLDTISKFDEYYKNLN